MASLSTIFPSKSAIFRISHLNITAKTKSSSINSASVRLRSEPISTTTTKIEFNSSNILFSTPSQNILINHPTQEQELQHAVKKIKGTLMRKLTKLNELEDLIMIDTIQRLGLQHHFQEEIYGVLEKHYNYGSCCCGDLHEVALRFRLLRQQGYHVTVDAFNKFMDKNGSFKHELSKDIKGLMSLFEASHIRVKGDYILDKASEFSGQLLKTCFKNVEQLEATIIANTLGNPYLRSLPRLMGKNFLYSLEPTLKLLHDFEDADGWTSDVRDLAKIDFNMVQITHQSEISQVHGWWKELNLTKELKLARDQPVKWHIWSLAALPNPSMEEERIQLTKPISLIYLIDDIFDVYGTLEELTIFTEAVNRWEYADIEGLPNYMKMCLKALHDTTDEISHKIYTKHGWDPKPSLKKSWVDLCNAFLVEAKWFSSGHLPRTEEYLENGLVSSGMQVVAVHLFYLMGKGINTKSIDHLNSFPDLVSSMATVLRLSDDLGSSKDENQDGYDGSFIECYKNENKGISEKMARDKVSELISQAWKCLNKICMCSSSPYSAEFTAACLNLTRMVPMMYSYDHHHRLPSLEKHMKSFFYETVI